MRATRNWIVGLAALALLFVPARQPQASSNGITGFSGDPATGGLDCNECHSLGSAPTVTLAGPQAVTPGSTHGYTLTISGGQRIAGGLDVSASAGALAVAEPGTWLAGNEVVHDAPRAVDANGDVQWTFTWTAPPVAGPATLYGAGNSVNLNNGPQRDRAARATLAIVVANFATPGEPSNDGGQPLVVTGYSAASGTMSLGYDPACEATNHNIYFGALTDVASLSWSGSDCAIGTSGTYAGFNPGPGSYFFVVVGTQGVDEGSYGQSRLTDGSEAERPAYLANACGQVQTLANPCP